ncbi:MAG: carbohydrate ABC transporter permease [Armatimonadetes bacterium]|nr:carbohydrate ABC transporter permease [Armatimonadota bacterium]
MWVLLTSLKSGPEVFASPWSLPKSPQWQNYSNAWQQAGVAKYFLNSLLVTLGTLLILLPIGAMAAYVLARYPFRGSKTIFGTFLGGMMFPNFLIIVPLFFLLKSMGMLDTKTGLILVYVAYSLSFTIFVLTGFFQSLPNELAEAAMIDGCTDSSTFWRVMLPLAKPGLVVVGIFNAIGLWNEYGLALVLVNSEENRTLPLGIANLVMTQHYQSDWGALFAGLVIVMLPVLVVYWVYRGKIHETMFAGAVKG